jgi:hypothetical protein
MFLQDIEEDPELRGQIDLYKVRVLFHHNTMIE